MRENILVAFNNLPSGLVKTNDTSMFGNSGEAIKEMKRMYWENTSAERGRFVAVLQNLLNRTADYSNLKLEPIKLTDDHATSDKP